MKRFFIAAMLLVSLAGLALASYISLNTSLVSKASDRELKAMVTSTNKGNESAFSVQAVIQLDGKTLRGEKKAELAVNNAYQSTFTVPLTAKMPGIYPLILTMHYADANQYPFSALTAQTYTYKSEPPQSEIIGRLTGATFWKNGTINLTLKNLSAQEIKTSVSLVTPRELIASGESRELILAPRSERVLNLGLENFSALSGSTYQLFAVLQYEKDGLHLTTIVTGLVKIVESRALFGLDYAYLVIILVGLVLIVALFQIFKK